MEFPTERQLKNYYIQKAKSSFKTRFDLLLFDCIVNDPSKLGEIDEHYLENYRIEDHEDALLQYITEYWQAYSVKDYMIKNQSVQNIYLSINDWISNNKLKINSLLSYYINHIFPEVFPELRFMRMINDGHECEYCHITEDHIKTLIKSNQVFKKHITRGWTLEIDRKVPYLEYTEENCVICCYWCNNAKTGEFSYDEFKRIGSVIQEIWHDRLKK